jgi:hypothetical protein
VIDIHVIVRSQLKHISLCCVLIRVHVPCIIMIFPSSFKCLFEGLMYFFLLFSGKSVPVEARQELRVAHQVFDITTHECFAPISLIGFVRMPLGNSYTVNNFLCCNILLTDGLLLWLEARPIFA